MLIIILKLKKIKNNVFTQYEYFEYQIIFFELINTFVIFQIYINKVLRKLMNVFCVIYLNNILVYIYFAK